jgi:hypothetical protein
MDKKNPWEFTGPEICTAVAPGRDPLGGLGKEIQEEWMAGFWYNIYIYYMVLLWIIYGNLWGYMGYYGNILFKHVIHHRIYGFCQKWNVR